MIKPIMKSEFFLRLPSEDAGPDDAATGQDLLDTLNEHEHECVGLAANMIGVRKRIICVKDGNRALLMYNPQILEQVNAYQTSEGCLSLIGERPCTRYRRIKVEYLDENFVRRIKNFSATPPRSSSTKSTTATESLFSSTDSRKLPAAKQLQGAFDCIEPLSLSFDGNDRRSRRGLRATL